MHIATAVIAVADKTVATRFTRASIHDGASRIDFINQQIAPTGVRHSISLENHLHTLTIMEIVFQRIIYACHAWLSGKSCCRTATLGSRSIHHVQPYTTMVHQLGNGHHLLIRRGMGCHHRHVSPIIKRMSEISFLHTISRMGIAMTSLTKSGILPIVHHLGLSRRGTACHRASRAVAIVRKGLVPKGGNQRLYALVRTVLGHQPLLQTIPFGGIVRSSL